MAYLLEEDHFQLLFFRTQVVNSLFWPYTTNRSNHYRGIILFHQQKSQYSLSLRNLMLSRTLFAHLVLSYLQCYYFFTKT